MAQHHQQPTNFNQSLTTPEAAQFIGIKPATLEHWRWEKCGPRYLKLGRAVRYRLEDLNAWLEAQQVEPSFPNDAA